MFDKPSAGGDQFAAKDHVGALLVVQVHRTEQVNTKYGEKTTPVCTIHVIGDDGTVTDEYVETFMFGDVLAGQLKRSVGRTVCGVLGLGTASGGNNPPYRLDEASDEQEARAVKAMTGKPAAAEQQPAAAAAPAGDDVPPWERKG